MTGITDVCRVKRHPDGCYYVQGARGGALQDEKLVLWGFRNHDCALAVCESLNALVIADAMYAVIDDNERAAA